MFYNGLARLVCMESAFMLHVHALYTLYAEMKKQLIKDMALQTL